MGVEKTLRTLREAFFGGFYPRSNGSAGLSTFSRYLEASAAKRNYVRYANFVTAFHTLRTLREIIFYCLNVRLTALA